MKLVLFMSLVLLVLFLGCKEVLEEILLPDYRITNCYWEDDVDQDHDGYSRSRSLVVEYDYGSEEIESGNIIVYCKGRTSPVASEYLSSWEVDGKESIKISELSHSQYSCEVHLSISIKDDPSGKSDSWDSSDDQQLKDQKFETDAQDQ